MSVNLKLSQLKHLGIYVLLIPGLLIVFPPNVYAAVKTPFQGGNYYALIIGNNNYQDKKGAWKPLNNAINDAMGVADVLKRRYAFSEGNIRFLTDATRGDILRALNDISKQVSANDSVLIFYAGHGYLNEDTDEAYWIPVDAQGADETNYLSHATVKRKLGVIADRASHVLLVSDSCFSGDIVRGVNLLPEDTSIDYYSKKAQKKSIQVIAAGGKEFVDDNYRRTGHSPFTYFFIEELESNSNQYLAVGEFITNIVKNVANNVKQTPVSGTLFGTGDEGGEFIFSHARLSPAEIQAEIDRLLSSAEDLFRQKKFISPPGNNARKRWQDVLRLDQNNTRAKQGLTRITKHFVSMAEKQIESEEFDEAEISLQVAEGITPNSPLVRSMRETLQKKRDYVSPPVFTW